MNDSKTDDRGAFVIPAFNPGSLLKQVLEELSRETNEHGLADVPVVVVDDGCTDGSCDDLDPRVILLAHGENLGKGTAIRTALSWADDAGASFIVTLDADGQHPGRDAVRLFLLDRTHDALVLGVRDLKKAAAPGPNQFSNAFSNWILTRFGGQPLHDTQCGLRRYPVRATLDLGASHPGYAFESEVVLRAARQGFPIEHLDIDVRYPVEGARVSHFDSWRDPAKNVAAVLWTTWSVPHHRATRRWGRRLLTGAILLAIAWWLVT